MNIETHINAHHRVFTRKCIVHYSLRARFVIFFDKVTNTCMTWHTPHPVNDFEDLWSWYEQTAEFHNDYVLYTTVTLKY